MEPRFSRSSSPSRYRFENTPIHKKLILTGLLPVGMSKFIVMEVNFHG